MDESFDTEYDDIDVPFAIIEQVPVYPGCENSEDKKECIVDKIQSFVNGNYDVSMAVNIGLDPGKKRVYVEFTIN